MAEDTTQAPAAGGSRGFYRFLLTLGILLLIFGLFASAGSLMSDKLSGERLDDPFDVLLLPVICYLIPSLLIAYSLSRMGSRVRLGVAGIVGITLFGAVLALAGEVMKTYNFFVRAEESVTQAFNNVEIAYQKRFNLIGNLDISSRGYQAHELAVVKAITDARRSVADAASENDKLGALNRLDVSVRNLVVNIEQYPNLKADKVVLELMKEITASERELLARKTEFNNRVTEYNRSIRLMPYALTARLFHFQPRRFIDREASADIYDARKAMAPAKAN